MRGEKTGKKKKKKEKKYTMEKHKKYRNIYICENNISIYKSISTPTLDIRWAFRFFYRHS